jgi:hypothetical protein
MSLSAGGSTAQQATSSQLDPEIKNRWMQLEGRADDAYRDISTGVKSGAYNIDPKDMVAPLNDVQHGAIDLAQGIARGNVGGGALQTAIDRASSAPTAASMSSDPRLTQSASYRPAYEIQESLAGAAPYIPAYEIQESTTGPAATYGGAHIDPATLAGAAQTDTSQLPGLAGGKAASGIADYMNPYEDTAVQGTVNDLFRAKQMTDTQNAGAATQAGAFGGSRHGVVDAETNRAFADRVGQISSQMRQAGFQTAVGASAADQDRALSADTTRYGTNANILQGNTGFRQQAGLAGMDAANTRAIQQAQLEQQAGLQGANDQNELAKFNATQSQNADLSNQAAENTAAQQMAGYGVDLSKFNAGQSQSADVFNANNENAAAFANADAADRASQGNADRTLQALSTGGQLQLQGAQALGGLGQEQRDFATGDYDLLKDAGATMQGNAQALADARTGEINRRMQLPMQALNAYLPVFGAAVPTMNSGGTVNSKSKGQQVGAGWGG